MFPDNNAQEVPKRRKGAGCIQIVIESSGEECGEIIYESKRTKNFNLQWVEKLKQDQLAEKSDIAVLVSEVLPDDMKGSGVGRD